MKRKLYLFLAWLHDYFRHPLPGIRSAGYIEPRKLYLNFGNVCICVPHTPAESAHLKRWPDRALPLPLLLQAVHSANPIKELDNMYGQLFDIIKTEDIPAHCNLCDFYRYGIPCPLHNHFRDGSPVCDTHKYIIIKHQK